MDERQRRWRLVLGDVDNLPPPEGDDLRIDQALAALYNTERKGGLGASSPAVARWLGDIRTYFPTPVVQLMQQDALERLDLKRLLLEPELLATVEPDVHLVATLLSLRSMLPAKTRATARDVVTRVVRALEARLRERTLSAVRGALDRASRTRRPRANQIDWPRTIRANLHTWRPATRAVVPERLVGHGRRQVALRDVILVVDQSGSMAASVVYASIFAAVLASMRAVRTRLVVFDTAVVDLTEALRDPVDVLFATQLGGGTDISRALTYADGLVERPRDTVMVLISDLFEGGDRAQMLRTAHRLVQAGVRLVVLLALTDSGAPASDPQNAAAFAALGVPTFACTPDRFPDLMAAALAGQDLTAWAAARGIPHARG